MENALPDVEDRSDSSMDDCNVRYASDPAWAQKGSDSSMDDCNHQGVIGRRGAPCSDSSMDDCNGTPGPQCRGARPVQIPLWTIVTMNKIVYLDDNQGSDSSMDDCNQS